MTKRGSKKIERARKTHEKLYMKTTGDKLDLPVAVADSPGELARILGTKKSVVLSSISHKIRGWHRIEIEEEEEMERGGMAK